MLIIPVLPSLKPHYEAYVEAYCTTAKRRPAQAVLDAGITTNITEARSIARRISQVPKVRKLIDEYLKMEISNDVETLYVVSEMANHDIIHFLNDEHEIDLSLPSAKANMHLVRKITHRKTKDGETTSIELYDKLHAAELMMRYHKLIGTEQSVSVQIDVNTLNAVLEAVPDEASRDAITAEIHRRLGAESLALPDGLVLEEEIAE